MAYEEEITCHIDINGQSSTVDAVVKQEYSGQSAEISVSFEWDALVVGSPSVQISDSGSAPSIMSTVPLTVTSNKHSVNNGIASPSKISGVVRSLDVYHASQPSPDEMVDIHFYLANFPGFARINTLQPNVSGIALDFQYSSDGKINKRAVVSGIEYSKLQEAIELVNDCCWLCSLAAGCFVTIPRIEVFRNGSIVLTKINNVDTSMPDIRKPLVHDRMSPNCLKDFLVGTISTYRTACADYSLLALIHLGLLAKHNHYLQVKALLMSDFLEVLRYQFASNIGVRTGVYVLRGTDFYRNGASNRASFAEILRTCCNHLGITCWNTDFKDLRNEIMHTGDFAGPNKTARYRRLHHFCDIVLLALLNWDNCNGQYVPFNHPVNNSSTHVGVNRIQFRR